MEDNNIQNNGNSDSDNLRGAASQTGVSGKAMLEGNDNIKGSEGNASGGSTGSFESDTRNNVIVGTNGGNEGTNGDLTGGAGGGIGIWVPGDDDTRMGTSGAGDTNSTQSND